MALRGRWVLNESGTASRVDASGNGNNLTASASISQVAGHGGGANLANDFTGAQYLTITDAAQTGLDFTGPFSISAWVKRGSGSGSQSIVAKWGTGVAAYHLYISSTGYPTGLYARSNGSGNTSVTSSQSLTLGVWTHVLWVYDGSTSKIYINNVERGSTSYAVGAYNTAAPFRIGATGDGAYLLTAGVDDVAVFDHALDSTERSDWYGYGDDFDGLPAEPAALAGDVTAVATVAGDLTTHAAAVLEGALASAATLTGELTASGSPAELAGNIACVTTLTGEFPSAAATLSGALHDREGNAINCATYNIRINVYPVGNIAMPPLESQLVTASSGAWSINSTSLVSGVKYIVTFEFIGTYTPLGDVDIAGCDVMTAY